jgi:protein AroM
MGQTPRADVMNELRVALGDLSYAEFGVLDDVPQQEIDGMTPSADELSFFTRLRDGRHVILEAEAVARRTAALVEQVDGLGYDLLILAMTGIRARLSTTRTPLIHGQYAARSLGFGPGTAGNSRIGIIIPAVGPRSPSSSESDYGTMLQELARDASAGSQGPRI